MIYLFIYFIDEEPNTRVIVVDVESQQVFFSSFFSHVIRHFSSFFFLFPSSGIARRLCWRNLGEQPFIWNWLFRVVR